jgi:hypothetical protein
MPNKSKLMLAITSKITQLLKYWLIFKF